MPGHTGGVHTMGFSHLFDPDFENSKCIVLWGLDVESSYRANFYRQIKAGLDNGAKLIVIDPRRNWFAERADVWMQIRPGTDCALALGLLNVIINKGLYDKEFVKKWTVGFDKLRSHVQGYTPQKIEEITWIPAEKIKEAAQIYANNSPAAIGTGIGGLCQNINAFQTNRAIAILVSVTGNIDIPGGHIDHTLILKDKATMAAQYDAAFGDLNSAQIENRLTIGRIPKNDGFIMAHSEAVFPAIREGIPYPVKALLSIGTNHIISKDNSMFVRDTLMKLNFFVVSDLFMTPTAEIADIVLPPAHWSERGDIIDVYTKNYIFCHEKIVDPPDECWDDKKILIELAKKIGLVGYWESVEEFLNERLIRIGMTFDDFKKKHIIESPVTHRKHEKYKGFKTSSKKVELYSEPLEKIGSDPLPVFREPPESPVSNPELSKKYPLILITGVKSLAYFHSSYRNIPKLRKILPEPLLEIHPEAAKSRDIEDGDWVEIKTERGSVRHKAKLSEKIHKGVVAAPHGWWYGYKDGWKEVNINILTDGKIYDPDVGSSCLKGLLCEVRKASYAPIEV